MAKHYADQQQLQKTETDHAFANLGRSCTAQFSVFNYNCSNLPAALRLIDVAKNTLTTMSTQLQPDSRVMMKPVLILYALWLLRQIMQHESQERILRKKKN